MFTVITPKVVLRVRGTSVEQVERLAKEAGYIVLSVHKDGTRFKGGVKKNAR